ncbi:hypothetical protein ACH4CD_01100 [Streptomyces fungicidicus]|uniref:hypothetical protein n=1 Tax=Streptomyces fungicidicus TaxID=68203 RepID=UPI0037BA24A0
MSNRHQGFRSAERQAAPLRVLRWAALLAVLAWVLPVCAHTDGPAVRQSVMSVPGAAGGVDGTARTITPHECPDTGHGQGDVRCRPADEAVASTGSSLTVPSPRGTDVIDPARTPNSPQARGAPEVLAHAPGIHQLQVQRT